MYKSPVELIMGQLHEQLEENVYKVVQDYGVVVDKDELIKALRYDRDQYEKGYADGRSARDSEIVRCFECKYHYKDGDNVVTSHCLLSHNHVQPSDWYCADGERSEDADS